MDADILRREREFLRHYQLSQEQIQGARREDLRRTLERMHTRCILCCLYLRDARHTAGACSDPKQEEVRELQKIFTSISYQQYSCCFRCGLPQAMCDRYREFRMKTGGYGYAIRHGQNCQYPNLASRAVVGLVLGAEHTGEIRAQVLKRASEDSKKTCRGVDTPTARLSWLLSYLQKMSGRQNMQTTVLFEEICTLYHTLFATEEK